MAIPFSKKVYIMNDTPLSDSDIRKWLPNCKILEYDWLEKVETIYD